MRKFLFYKTIILAVLLIAFLLTPSGAWMLFVILGSGDGHIIVVIVAGIAFMIGATYPNEKIAAKTRRWLLSAICAVAAFVILGTLNFGGTLHGEWTLVRDARVDGFRIATSPNFRLYFERDGTLRRIYPDYGIENERTWQRGVLRNMIMIGGIPYNYRFSLFGQRLTLELSGAERPRIPHMSPQSHLEATFRRSGGITNRPFAIIAIIAVAFGIYKIFSTPKKKFTADANEENPCDS